MCEIGLIGAGDGHYEFVELAKICCCEVTHIYDDSANRTDLEYIIVENRIRSDLPYIFSIGDPKIKKELDNKLHPKTLSLLMHPNTFLGRRAELGRGLVVQMGSRISNDTKIGKNVFLNFDAGIAHNSVIGDYCFIGPNVTILPKAQVGEGVYIGGHAIVLEHIKVGEWSKIGAGSVVTKNVEPYTVVVGNPARFLKNVGD